MKRFLMSFIAMGVILFHMSASALQFNLIESTYSVSGSARAFAWTPSFLDSYSLSGPEPLFGRAEIGGGPNEPMAKIESYADQQTVFVQQYPRSSGPEPYLVETYAMAQTDLLLSPDFNGTGEAMIFSFSNGGSWRGGNVKVTDVDNGVTLFSAYWGYNHGVGDGSGEIVFQYDGWNSDTRYLLSMNVSAQEYEQDIKISMANNITFSPVPEPTTMLLIGLGLIGVAGVRKKFKN